MSTVPATEQEVALLRTQLAETKANLGTLNTQLEEAQKLKDELKQLDTNLDPSTNAVIKFLESKLSEIKGDLDSIHNKTFPEWVATVDVATGMIFYMNTVTKESTWEEPEGYTGIFAMADQVNGFTATTQLSRK